MDGAFSQNIPLFIPLFIIVDFKKAYDSIYQDMIFAILQCYGIPDKIVSAIRVLYDKTTGFIKAVHLITNSFQNHLLLTQECYKLMNYHHFYSSSW